MAVMIKLQLPPGRGTFEDVLTLPGLQGLVLDPSFGLVPIDPRASLYVVRADSFDNLARRKELSPELIDVYGDIRIDTM